MNISSIALENEGSHLEHRTLHVLTSTPDSGAHGGLPLATLGKDRLKSIHPHKAASQLLAR
ncbi:hypothetical protein T02_6681 [Trichinella nativa]|uniref:Uncharacterized protein n=1 Tax=Trichinella nativa TaxID=6335 RepID=A0A0V1KWM8_9BILA|nr:hypothetical protein T02_6681 [Trichinella nativa]